MKKIVAAVIQMRGISINIYQESKCLNVDILFKSKKLLLLKQLCFETYIADKQLLQFITITTNITAYGFLFINQFPT